ncbi:MAG: tRNA (N6-isopentenyl adenosine(37)-C2)-methylthiotransferase MiaB [Nitrospinota bacterium]|nr:tRNA (N6-isopentenyl adenosine(37)-C2)-methylthiotransferase MiaB [Nitrospinota bacterium]
MTKRYSLYTYGCQMNKYDSETISGYLEEEGYSLSAQLEDSDLVIVNTCSIREKAEEKVYSQIGRLSKLKKKNPNLKIAVCGCFANRAGEQIAKRAQTVDLVFGTQNISKLPNLLEKLEEGRVLDTKPVVPDFTSLEPINRENGRSCWVSIARGCDNFCTFCVVPYTRGPEWSKPSHLIVEEIEKAVQEGFLEVTLLGQNVNSYGLKDKDELSFGRLLGRINKIEGLRRIRFITSHPQNCDLEMFESMASYEKVCEHLHLPFQSGSNNILKKMERGYTSEEYLEKVSMFYDKVPEGVLTSDVIVGFPGETDKDFDDTLELIRNSHFESIYSFKYSPRPGTPAFGMDCLVDSMVIDERFEELTRVQKEITKENHDKLLGSVQEVLIDKKIENRESLLDCYECCSGEAHSEKEFFSYAGRNRGSQRVIFLSREENLSVGQIVDIKILRSGVQNVQGYYPEHEIEMELV